MNNDLRNEMLVVLNTENVCDDCQIRILHCCSKFINNHEYMEKVKKLLNLFFFVVKKEDEEINFWVELPKMITILIDLNKRVVTDKDMEIDYMKFVLYAIIYSYLDTEQSETLNRQSPGDLRICFINILGVLLTKPKRIKITKETIWHMLSSCICSDDNEILL